MTVHEASGSCPACTDAMRAPSVYAPCVGPRPMLPPSAYTPCVLLACGLGQCLGECINVNDGECISVSGIVCLPWRRAQRMQQTPTSVSWFSQLLLFHSSCSACTPLQCCSLICSAARTHVSIFHSPCLGHRLGCDSSSSARGMRRPSRMNRSCERKTQPLSPAASMPRALASPTRARQTSSPRQAGLCIQIGIGPTDSR